MAYTEITSVFSVVAEKSRDAVKATVHGCS